MADNRYEVSWDEKDKYDRWQRHTETFRDYSTAIEFRDHELYPRRSYNPGKVSGIDMHKKED